MNSVKFGTDGWRAVLNEDFNFENVNRVINGIASYVYKKSKFDKTIIIGYDPRNKADEFAFYIADKLSNSGFSVEISDKIVATPVLAYNALYKNAYALMLTASHNPPQYLGIKFIPPYGGPAEDYMVKEITDNLDNEFKSKGLSTTVCKTSFEKDYISHIKSIIDLEKIKQSNISVNYDGHHGAAGKLFLHILDEFNIKYNAQNIERDINFGGFMPDPKEEFLPSLKKLCKENNKIGLSNDGDGDRFGVFDENGVFISPNDIIAMLLKHLVYNRAIKGKLAKTVGASGMLNIYAENLGVGVVETPVGFKWLGSAMRKDDIIIAGEESGGLSIKGHIPEKDGILANLLIMEMLAFSNKKLCDLHKDFLIELNRNFINERVDLKLSDKSEQDKIIEQAKNLKQIYNINIIKTNSIDGLKLYLEDESSILIRKSGTEPLLRIYFETDTKEKLENFKISLGESINKNLQKK